MCVCVCVCVCVCACVRVILYFVGVQVSVMYSARNVYNQLHLGMCLNNERKLLGVALYVGCTVSKYPNKPFTLLIMWLFLLVSIIIPPFPLTKWPRKGCSGIFGPIAWSSPSQIILANQITTWPRVYQKSHAKLIGDESQASFRFFCH